MRKLPLTAGLLFALFSLPLAAEPEPFVWVPQSLSAEFVLGVPAGPDRDLWPAARLEYLFLPGPWGMEFSYAFRGKEYYYFNHAGGGWSGPSVWNQRKADGLPESEWPFYQTRHVLSPGLVFQLDRELVVPKMALGLLVQFYLPSNASPYYPEYESEYDDFNSGVEALFGNYLRLGLDLDLVEWLSLGADFVFEVPDWGTFYSAVQEAPQEYARDHAQFEIRIGGSL